MTPFATTLLSLPGRLGFIVKQRDNMVKISQPHKALAWTSWLANYKPEDEAKHLVATAADIAQILVKREVHEALQMAVTDNIGNKFEFIMENKSYSLQVGINPRFYVLAKSC